MSAIDSTRQSALSLYVEFGNPNHAPQYVYVPFLDKARSERYSMLYDALSFNPDRRFPNLDKILPLPPAPLPPWDGTRESLLSAAMAVVPKPISPTPTEASARHGRYFLDTAYTFLQIKEATSGVASPVSSYWRPAAPMASAELRSFLNTIPPGLYQKGEPFEQLRYPSAITRDDISHVIWERMLTVHNNGGAAEPRAVSTLARMVDRRHPAMMCDDHSTCPVTGTWQPWLPPGHPFEHAVNQPWRQRWLTAEQPFPDAKRDWMLSLKHGELKWHLIETEVSKTQIDERGEK